MENIDTTTVSRPLGFDGVFRFTNATNEDFSALWNNKEYTFPKQSTCPMIIEGETLENIQEIRKRFATRLAEREYMKSQAFQSIKNGDGRTVLSTYNQKELDVYIQQCLEPLPIAEVKVTKKATDDEKNYKGSKAIKGDIAVAANFEGTEVQELGQMPG